MAIDPKRVKEIFLEAADLSDEAARAAYLDKACGSDAGLRSRVEALLRAHDPEGSFLGTPGAVVPDADHAATQTLAGSPRPAAAAAQTTDGENGSSHHEPLTFLTPSARPDALGRIGHYEVLQVLGRGGFGIVFRAFDEMLQRVVALKVLAPQLAATSPARKRFLREARSAAQVRHENVVHVYEVAEQPLPYLAMEFIPGETLQQKLDRVGPLEVPEALRIGRQIAEGLAAAHATDLIHRDIKPANVLLEGGHQKVKITDFGLARTADDASLTQSGMVAGTPMYMAPEQALGQTLDQRADLFSLGSVLYQMVAGRPPFRANTTIAVLKRVAEDKPRAIREIIPETPQWLCDIIAKLHAKDPDDRYQSAREVADVLADCEAQLKANSKLKDHSRIPRTKPQRSGRRKWVAVAAAVLLPVVALAVTEFTGVTHLFRGQQIRSDTSKSGSDPQAKAGAGWNGWPAEAPLAASAPFDAAQARAHQEAWAKYLGVPVEYTNSVGIKFRLIPPGEFMMGSGASELDEALKECASTYTGVYREQYEGQIRSASPQHKVVLTLPIYLGVHEVTQGQYESVMGLRPSHFAVTGEGREAVAGKGTSQYPVERLTWQDTVQFCIQLSEREGLSPSYTLTNGTATLLRAAGYRLPTEAEWEFACRAGTTTKYWSGDREEDLARVGWFAGNSGSRTHGVGELPANPFGLCDMHGNVWEWMQDWYQLDYYKQFLDNSVTNPPGPAFSPTNERVLRGGTFGVPTCRCYSAHRAANVVTNPPGFDVGFRVVHSVEAVKQAIKGSSLAAPFTDADVQRIAALPAAQQVEEVRKELMRRNRGFDGTLTPTIQDDAVIGLAFPTDQVTDIAPVRALTRLQKLDIHGPGYDKAVLADLSPLKGMPLKWLNVGENRVSDLTPLTGMPLEWLAMWQFRGADLTPLKNMPLKWLNCGGGGGQKLDLTPLAGLPLEFLCVNHTRVSDLTPLKGVPLTTLFCSNTPVSDLTPLRGMRLKILQMDNTKASDLSPLKEMPLSQLHCCGSGVTDLSPLKGMQLEDIRLTPNNIAQGLDILRDMKGLKTIGIVGTQAWPAAEFWDRYDKGEFTK